VRETVAYDAAQCRVFRTGWNKEYRNARPLLLIVNWKNKEMKSYETNQRKETYIIVSS